MLSSYHSYSRTLLEARRTRGPQRRIRMNRPMATFNPRDIMLVSPMKKKRMEIRFETLLAGLSSFD